MTQSGVAVGAAEKIASKAKAVLRSRRCLVGNLSTANGYSGGVVIIFTVVVVSLSVLEDALDMSDRSVRLSSSEMRLPVVGSGLPSGLVTPSVTDGSNDSLEGWL